MTDNQLFRSVDGETWTQTADLSEEGVVLGLTFSEDRFLAVARPGLTNGWEPSQTVLLLSSRDGQGWERQSSALPKRARIGGVAAGGDQVLLLVAEEVDGGELLPYAWLATTNAGASWLHLNLPAPSSLYVSPSIHWIAYGAGRFVIDNSDANLKRFLISTNGLDLTSVEVEGVNSPGDLIYAAGRFYGLGYGPSSWWVLSSSDGLRWDRHEVRDVPAPLVLTYADGRLVGVNAEGAVVASAYLVPRLVAQHLIGNGGDTIRLEIEAPSDCAYRIETSEDLRSWRAESAEVFSGSAAVEVPAHNGARWFRARVEMPVSSP